MGINTANADVWIEVQFEVRGTIDRASAPDEFDSVEVDDIDAVVINGKRIDLSGRGKEPINNLIADIVAAIQTEAEDALLIEGE